METTYKNLGYFFILLLATAIWGFYYTFHDPYPDANGLDLIRQIHGSLLISWFLLLIVQPFLIRYNRIELHRKIGLLSYILAPLIVLSIFLVARHKFNRLEDTSSAEENIGDLLLNICSMFYFALLFLLAMYYKRRTALHMRYMIASALLLFGPGLGRIFIHYAGLSFGQSVTYAVLTTELITALLIIYDLRKGNNYKPYAVTLVFLLLFQLLWSLRFSAGWQIVGSKFAEVFF